jgi:hypothetical protein
MPPSDETRSELPSTVSASQVLTLFGRLSALPPGSAHSRTFTRTPGLNMEFGLTFTDTTSPSW